MESHVVEHGGRRPTSPGDPSVFFHGIRPVEDPFVDVVLPTGLDHLPNASSASADSVGVVGGGADACENRVFLMYKRLIVSPQDKRGWGGSPLTAHLTSRSVSHIAEDRIFGANA